MKLIIDIPEDEYKAICKDYIAVHACPFLLGNAIKNGTLIPDTTNGEVIKALYPKGITAKFATFMRFIDGKYYFNCSDEWWNAPYQKGGANGND